jgi:predicted nucleic acid-binding protein
MAYVKIVGFTLDVIENVTLLRQEHALKMVEAVVAATALVHQAKLMTHSPSDFTSVAGLTIINPDYWKVDVGS